MYTHHFNLTSQSRALSICPHENFLYILFYQIKSNQIKSNQIKSNNHMTIDPFTAGRICGRVRDEGCTRKSVADSLGISKNTVAAVLKRFPADGSTPTRRARNLNTPFQRQIKKRRTMMKNFAKATSKKGSRKCVKFATARRIREAAVTKNIQVSQRTVQRDLKACGFKCVVRHRCSSLQPRHVTNRLKFARNFVRDYKNSYPEWSPDIDVYKQVVFSDEHYCTGNDISSRQMWVGSRKDIIPREVAGSFNTKRIMVWGAVGHDYKSKLVVFDTSIKDPETDKRNTQTQISYLRRCLSRGVIKHCRERKKIYMHDGARMHTAKMCTDYIRRQGVKLITNWPAHTPRLNPIEKIWAHLDELVSDMGPVNTVQELINNVHSAWESIDQSTIDKFVLQFETALKECRQQKGEY